MLFPTVEFAVFFALVLPISWLLRPYRIAWRWVMLLASYLFYGWWDWRFVGLLVASTVLNQAVVGGLQRTTSSRFRGWLLAAGVSTNLSILGFFKYYGFFVVQVEVGLHALGIAAHPPLLEIILPVGISFFTFQALSYVIDVYRGRARPTTLLGFGVYLAFFPQLVAGPIVRASEFLPQLASPGEAHSIDLPRAVRLIVGGLFKKVVIADLLARELADAAFTHPGDFSGPELLLAVYAFAVQIYCDFSAYSDIAIGVALLLGLRFPDNFDAPYAATSIQDFWRRWHMTLSRWLRDYLYIPLGGNRRGRVRTYVNLAITMLLGGLWHGASWRFVLWGALHGGGLAVERAWQEWRGPGEEPGLLGRWVRRLLVFHFVCLAWIYFRAPTIEQAGELMAGLTRGWATMPELSAAFYGALGLGMAVQFVPRSWLVLVEEGYGRLHPVVQGMAVAGFLLALDLLGPEGVAAFIYFQF